MKRITKRPYRYQKGAVAIIVALCAIVLFAFMGIALDLGRTYNAKTELQNAADAAALAGAKELNQTVAGVRNAETKAIAIAKQHTYTYSTPVSNTSGSNIILMVGECPDDSCMVLSSSITSDDLAVGKTFLKAETGLRTMNTYFMRVAGSAFDTTQTFGMAVAGRFVNNVAPIGVCAIDPDNVTKADLTTNELLELGFRRGVSYNIPALNPLGAQGTPYLINPVDAPPASCQPSHSSADFTAPFICSGRSAVVTSTPAQVYVNTGGSYGKIEKALNSRFDVFGGGSPCDAASAPPDINIHEYKCTGSPGTNPGCVTNPPAGSPRDWMDPAGSDTPTQETVSLDPLTNRPLSPLLFSQYGVLWSYSRAVHADGSTPPQAGTAFTLSDWPTLYGGSADTSATGYPASAAIPPFPAGTLPSPYAQSASSAYNQYFEAPSVPHPGVKDRRVLNIAILDCTSLSGGGLSCSNIKVVGIGKFFMQEKADLTGNPKRIDTEFAGLIEPVPTSEIKLYR